MSSNQAKKDSIRKRILTCRELYLMLLLPVIWYILFLYTPMYGIMIAFKDYRAARGIWGSEWIGLEHFKRFFSSFYFGRIVGNTLTINLLSLLFGFPFPFFWLCCWGNCETENSGKCFRMLLIYRISFQRLLW